jgi:hypothetical protein
LQQLHVVPNTWLQTCWFALDDIAPSPRDEDDYLDNLKLLLHQGIKPKGVLLYGIARASMQPEAPRLKSLPQVQIEGFARRIRELGITVNVVE